MYEDIKKKLQEIIDKEPVSNAINNDVISAYELSQIFCKEVKETLEALDAEKKVFAINQKYMIVNNLVRKISNIGKKRASVPIFMKTLKDIKFDCNRGTSSIVFIFTGNTVADSYLRVNKVLKDSALYYTNEKYLTYSKVFFVNDNTDYILNVFQKIEQFVEKYDVEIINNRLVFPNNEDTLKYCIEDFLEIKLFIRNDIDNPRKVAMDIDVKLVDKKLDKLFHSEWSNRERLDSFVLRNKEKLLRNIKISIEELPPFYRKLIESYYSKKEKPKVLQK